MANSGSESPTSTPVLVALPRGAGAVTQVVAGDKHTLALTSSGQLYAFGRNKWGELGVTTNVETNAANPVPAQVTLPGASGAITNVAAGSNHTLVVTASGQMYAFGRDKYGELGIASDQITNTAHPTPEQVQLPGAR